MSVGGRGDARREGGCSARPGRGPAAARGPARAARVRARRAVQGAAAPLRLQACPAAPPPGRPRRRGVAKEFKGKDVEKGIAVPTCISVNQCVGHHSPLNDCAAELKEGDLVKM